MNSGTSKNSRTYDLDTSVQFLKGVGPRIAMLLEGKGIRTIRDVLYYLPRDYQDRSTLKPIATLTEDEPALVRGKVISHSIIPIRTMRRPLAEAKIQDGSGILSIKWFHYNRAWLEARLKEKPWIIAYGSVKRFGAKLEMIHPDIEWDADEDDAAAKGGILPLYSETEGLNQKLLRKIVKQALELGLDKITDDLPVDVLASHKLIPMRAAIQTLHFPTNTKLADLRAIATPEQRRLIFDELFKFEWVVGRRRVSMRREHTKAYPRSKADAALGELEKRLPFELTGDQKSAIDKIFADLSEDKPMNRLLQGDVGCGKTLVAFAAALPVIAGGGQAALMAPTEILAEQHLKNAHRYLDGLARVSLLAGSTPKAQREQILGDLKDGRIDMLVGTHALIEDPVVFRELGLVVIDEQHRFGVDQRLALRAKGRHPHVLSLTATPIPRTLALTAYGDLDVSVIRELPKGRPEILTRIIRNQNRDTALDLVTNELRKGRQAYIIYPLVEESEKSDLADAVAGAEELKNGALKEFQVGLLHGRMKAQEKSAIMEEFKRGRIQALVSTTVIEVGVDVPNATVMMIEHSERFGLSQLHQLRGRIGRGTEKSYCVLMTPGSSQQAYERLKAMEQTRDGFRLAELDLKIRGPGEFLGTRQSGELQFLHADLVRDQLVLEEARRAAFEILKSDPDLRNEANAPLRRYMIERGQLQQERFETA